jgi:hypothetical protein
MATIINNDRDASVERVRDTTSDSGGWAVAVIVLIVLLAAGAYAWTRYHRAAPANTGTPGSANINVTLPSSGTSGSGSGSTGGGTSGGTQSGGTGSGAAQY